MTKTAPRSIDAYLGQLREELAGEDPALIQDALYDAEEYLRAEVATHPDRAEADVLELIASTYGAPDEVAAAYRETEARVEAALKTPRRTAPAGPLRRLFAVYTDPRAYGSLLLMFLSMASGIVYFTIAIVGVSLSAGLAVLIIGLPVFLMFIGITRAIALAEGRLVESVTGERMPRRPVHPAVDRGFWGRMGDMLRDPRTWTTLAYLVLALPLGIAYFVIAVTGLSVGASLALGSIVSLFDRAGWIESLFGFELLPGADWSLPIWLLPFVFVLGVLIVTGLMHLARVLMRLHAQYAKAMLVAR